jgi:hypothetical protein
MQVKVQVPNCLKTAMPMPMQMQMPMPMPEDSTTTGLRMVPEITPTWTTLAEADTSMPMPKLKA